VDVKDSDGESSIDNTKEVPKEERFVALNVFYPLPHFNVDGFYKCK